MSRSALQFINNPASHELSGPDFLLAIATAEESIGNQVNAEEYRRRATQWQRDLDAIHALPAIEQPAANADEWPTLPKTRRAGELPAHHITPSDHR